MKISNLPRRNPMKLLQVLPAALLIFVTTARPAQRPAAPLCVTHFNNQSNFQWSIYNFDGRKSALFIPPHATVAINWGTTSEVTISGEIPNGAYKQQFVIQ